MSRSFYGKLHRRFGHKVSGAERNRRSAKKQADFKTKRNRLLPPASGAKESSRHIIIIGAGFAGMCAAYYLNKYDVTFDILEAMPDRIGGRVHSLKDYPKGRIVEAGAELIGTNHPLWLKFASQYGLGLSALTSEDQFSSAGLEMPLVIGGKVISPDEAEYLYNQMTAVFQDISKQACTMADAFKPWEFPDAEKFDKMSITDKLTDLDVSPGTLLYEAIELQMVNNNVAPIDKQSYLGLLALVKGGSFADDIMAYWTETEIYHCANGNDSLAVSIDKDLGYKARTGQAVDSITINESGVVVTTLDGGKYEGDYVILTAPNTAWHHIKFSPPIPSDYFMTMGPAVKYLSPVSDRFWIHTANAPSSMSNDLGMTWEGTDNQTKLPGQDVEFTVFAGGAYASTIMNPPGQQTPLEYINKGITQMYSNYNEFVAEQGTLVEWPTVPYIETGYSCPTVGQVCTTGRKLNAAFPEGESPGRIYFAGEHTCMAYFGYMEGALESGFKAASRVLDAAGIIHKQPLK